MLGSWSPSPLPMGQDPQKGPGARWAGPSWPGSGSLLSLLARPSSACLWCPSWAQLLLPYPICWQEDLALIKRRKELSDCIPCCCCSSVPSGRRCKASGPSCFCKHFLGVSLLGNQTGSVRSQPKMSLAPAACVCKSFPSRPRPLPHTL